MIKDRSAANHTNFSKFTLFIAYRVGLFLMLGIVISLLSADIISNNGFSAIRAVALHWAFYHVRLPAGCT